jgi:predicted HTH domain antitoxin
MQWNLEKTLQEGYTYYSAGGDQMQCTIELPEDSFSALRVSPQAFAEEMKKAAAVKWYELGKISQEKAAEICGVNRLAFFQILLEYKVSILQDSEESLAWELDSE